MNPNLNSIARAPDRLVAATQRTAWDHVNTIAVVLTLTVLIWYTIETSKLRKAAQSQTEEAGRSSKKHNDRLKQMPNS